MSILEINLDKLCDTGLFHQAGNASQGFARVPNNWEEAIALIHHDEDDLEPRDDWSAFQIDRANDLRSAVRSVSVARYHEWNNHVKWAQQVVAERFPEVLEHTRVPSSIIECTLPDVRWSLVHAHLEESYADITSVDFYQQMCVILVEGHFPCGWEGQYPAGRPIVY